MSLQAHGVEIYKKRGKYAILHDHARKVNDEKELRRINRDQNVFSVDNDKYYV